MLAFKVEDKTALIIMKSGKVVSERAGLVTKGPIFEKPRDESSATSIFEEDVGLNKLGTLAFVAQKPENLVYENTYNMVPDESKTFSPGMEICHL